MIARIRLQNFQAHEDLTLEFDAGLNAVLGPSNAGKTAIVRAVKWVWMNRPSGDAFIRHGADWVRVEIETTDGDLVVRYKDRDGQNWYEVNSVRYNAVGLTVPQAVQDILNFDPHMLQEQFAQHFLLSDSAGEVARKINQVIELDKVDRAFSELKRLQTVSNQTLKSLRERRDAGKRELKRLAVIDRIDEELEELEKLDEANRQTVREIAELTDLIQQAAFTRQWLVENGHRIARLDREVQRLSDMGEKYRKLVEEETSLQDLLSAHDEIVLSIAADEVLTNDSTIALAEEGERWKKLLEEERELSRAIGQAKRLGHTAGKKGEELERLEELWHSKFPEQCPLCGREMR